MERKKEQVFRTLWGVTFFSLTCWVKITWTSNKGVDLHCIFQSSGLVTNIFQEAWELESCVSKFWFQRIGSLISFLSDPLQKHLWQDVQSKGIGFLHSFCIIWNNHRVQVKDVQLSLFLKPEEVTGLAFSVDTFEVPQLLQVLWDSQLFWLNLSSFWEIIYTKFIQHGQKGLSGPARSQLRWCVFDNVFISIWVCILMSYPSKEPKMVHMEFEMPDMMPVSCPDSTAIKNDYDCDMCCFC